jgi:hypothetical protein
VRVLTAVLAGLLLAGPAVAAPATAARPGKSVTRRQALEIARRELARDPANGFVIDEAKTLQKEFGWVFFYSPRAYLKSHDPKDLVPGSGPLVVERAGGATTYLSSSVPPEQALEEFEKEWRRRASRKR